MGCAAVGAVAGDKAGLGRVGKGDARPRHRWPRSPGARGPSRDVWAPVALRAAQELQARLGEAEAAVTAAAAEVAGREEQVVAREEALDAALGRVREERAGLRVRRGGPWGGGYWWKLGGRSVHWAACVCRVVSWSGVEAQRAAPVVRRLRAAGAGGACAVGRECGAGRVGGGAGGRGAADVAVRRSGAGAAAAPAMMRGRAPHTRRDPAAPLTALQGPGRRRAAGRAAGARARVAVGVCGR